MMADDGMQKILERAREMQDKQNRRLAETIVEATAADGKIRGKMNGHRALISLRIDPDFVSLDERATIESAVAALVNELIDKMDRILADQFGIVDKMPSLSLENIFGN